MNDNVVHTADKETKLYIKRVMVDFDGVIRMTGGECLLDTESGHSIKVPDIQESYSIPNYWTGQEHEL